MKEKNRILIYSLLILVVIMFTSSCVKDDIELVIPVPEYYAAISAGLYHSLALEPDGTLWAWGRYSFGRLGDDTFGDKYRPVRIDTDYSAISAGNSHSLGLKKDGTLWAWGYNEHGELGDCTFVNRHRPVQIGIDYSAISAGGYHSMGLKKDGTLWAWGLNSSGQIGDGTMEIIKKTPVMIGSGFIAISAGSGHSLGLKDDGTLWAWGGNYRGQLGDGSKVNRSIPVLIGSDYIAISAGIEQSLAIKSDGTLWSWGFVSYDPSGLGMSYDSTKPVMIGTDYAAISAGGGYEYFFGGGVAVRHSIAIKTNGTVWTWGINDYGQLGDGTNNSKNVPVQIDSTLILNPLPSSISAGGESSFALALDGTLWAWGKNEYGQLGDGTIVDKNRPVQVGDH